MYSTCASLNQFYYYRRDLISKKCVNALHFLTFIISVKIYLFVLELHQTKRLLQKILVKKYINAYIILNVKNVLNILLFNVASKSASPSPHFQNLVLKKGKGSKVFCCLYLFLVEKRIVHFNCAKRPMNLSPTFTFIIHFEFKIHKKGLFCLNM